VEAPRYQKNAGKLDQVQMEHYLLKDWTGWLMRRFKGLKTCHWLSYEVEIEYHNFTNTLIKRCKTKGKSEGCHW